MTMGFLAEVPQAPSPRNPTKGHRFRREVTVATWYCGSWAVRGRLPAAYLIASQQDHLSDKTHDGSLHRAGLRRQIRGRMDVQALIQLRQRVNLVPVMKVEVHRQRRRRMFGMYEENVCSRSKSARGERVLSDYTSLVVRRYTGITLGFRSQGVEQFV